MIGIGSEGLVTIGWGVLSIICLNLFGRQPAPPSHFRCTGCCRDHGEYICCECACQLVENEETRSSSDNSFPLPIPDSIYEKTPASKRGDGDTRENKAGRSETKRRAPRDLPESENKAAFEQDVAAQGESGRGLLKNYENRINKENSRDNSNNEAPKHSGLQERIATITKSTVNLDINSPGASDTRQAEPSTRRGRVASPIARSVQKEDHTELPTRNQPEKPTKYRSPSRKSSIRGENQGQIPSNSSKIPQRPVVLQYNRKTTIEFETRDETPNITELRSPVLHSSTSSLEKGKQHSAPPEVRFDRPIMMGVDSEEPQPKIRDTSRRSSGQNVSSQQSGAGKLPVILEETSGSSDGSLRAGKSEQRDSSGKNNEIPNKRPSRDPSIRKVNQESSKTVTISQELSVITSERSSQRSIRRATVSSSASWQPHTDSQSSRTSSNANSDLTTGPATNRSSLESEGTILNSEPTSSLSQKSEPSRVTVARCPCPKKFPEKERVLQILKEVRSAASESRPKDVNKQNGKGSIKEKSSVYRYATEFREYRHLHRQKKHDTDHSSSFSS